MADKITLPTHEWVAISTLAVLMLSLALITQITSSPSLPEHVTDVQELDEHVVIPSNQTKKGEKDKKKGRKRPKGPKGHTTTGNP